MKVNWIFLLFPLKEYVTYILFGLSKMAKINVNFDLKLLNKWILGKWWNNVDITIDDIIRWSPTKLLKISASVKVLLNIFETSWLD